MTNKVRPFPVGCRVERKTPPPGTVVGYLSTDRDGRERIGNVVVRWDDTDEVQFLPASVLKAEGER